MDTFNDLLDRYVRAEGQADGAAERARVEAEMWDGYGVEQAVFVLDMAGFSRAVQRHGLVHYLSMVRRMRVNVRPIVERAGGTVVKFEADNCFARFVDTAPAIDAAIAINRALDDLNRTTRDELDIRVSIGIDYGPILLVETPDYFGEAVNLASKLGEDLAQAGEILVSERAMQRLGGDRRQGEAVSFVASGVRLSAHRIDF